MKRRQTLSLSARCQVSLLPERNMLGYLKLQNVGPAPEMEINLGIMDAVTACSQPQVASGVLEEAKHN